MSSSILEMLAGQLGGQTTRDLSRSLGTDESATGQTLSAALPLLLSALQRNSASPAGAAALNGALERDHDGSVFNDMSGYLADPKRGNGAGILGHVFGSRRATVEQGLARTSGMDASSVGRMLEFAAPLVMGALGKERKERHLDGGGLSDLLRQEGEQTARREPEASSFFTKLLDADGDGSALDDVARMGKGLLGRFFGGR